MPFDKLFGGGPEVVDTESEPWEPLQPYLIGDAGPNWARNPGINYNWLDAAQQLAEGMPVNRLPPMFMNDPRMTFDDVYTPYEGGPWGYGFGPGELTREAGIPEQPGNFVQSGILDYITNGTPVGTPTRPVDSPSGGNFLVPPPGFVPSAPTNPEERPTQEQPDYGLTTDLLLRAQKKYEQMARWERDANEGYGSPYSLNVITAAMMENPDLRNRELDRAIKKMWLRSRGASVED